uniref:Large ribosomal subunit protein bL25 beta domain-containing protein n=1 Tax=Brassica oleracea var. oleracea TaxID=109376 RepID=A0A0D3A5M8_BRAOL
MLSRAVLREHEQAEIILGQDANRLKLGLGRFAIAVQLHSRHTLPKYQLLHSSLEVTKQKKQAQGQTLIIFVGATASSLVNVGLPLCPAEIIPPYIEVDLSHLDVGQKLVTGDLKVHPALKLIKSKDEPVVKIARGRVSDQQKDQAKKDQPKKDQTKK